MKRLIVTADDFGMARSINEGIARAVEEGIVTSINVIPAGKMFFEATTLLRTLKPKEIGAHLALTEVGSVTEPSKIPSLVTKEGDFHKSYIGFLGNFLLNRIDRNHIYTELRAQLERLKNIGIPITSLSSHEYIHMIPQILRIFIELAKEYGVPAMRFLDIENIIPPFSLRKIYRRAVLSGLSSGMKRILDESHVSHTDHLIGFLDSGNLSEDGLLRMLKSLKDGTSELVSHPGFFSPDVLDRCIFHQHCETDLAALTSRRVKRFIEKKGIELIPFSKIGAEGEI